MSNYRILVTLLNPTENCISATSHKSQYSHFKLFHTFEKPSPHESDARCAKLVTGRGTGGTSVVENDLPPGQVTAARYSPASSAASRASSRI